MPEPLKPISTHPSKAGAATPSGRAQRRRRLAFLVSEDWYFCTHRLALALAAVERGYEVTVITRVNEHGDRMRRAGLSVIPMEMSRSGMHPLRELATVRGILQIYRELRPDVVHHVALKPVVLGSLAARLAGVPRVVNAIAGFGYVFASREPKAALLRPVLRTVLPVLLDRPGVTTIVQNVEDEATLSRLGIAPARCRLIRGAGVDLRAVTPVQERSGLPVVMLAARMLWDKGVGEFVEAARLLRARGCDARYVLVGRPDPGNPKSVPESQLARWHDEGVVEWWGYSRDINETLASCHVFCLPTFYGEGIPKILLEAAAAGRAIIASDIAGCREVIRNNVNGVLVKPRDSGALAEAVYTLLGNPSLRQRLGQSARRAVEQAFSLEHVIDATMAVYAESTV